MEINLVNSQEQLLSFTNTLHETAIECMNMGDPKLANIKMASTISTQSSIFLIKDLHVSITKNTDMAILLNRMCIDVGQTFIDAGTDKESAAYKDAIRNSTAVAYKYVPEALKILGIDVDIDKAIDKIDIKKEIEIQANDRKLPFNQDLSLDQIKKSILKSLDPDDSFGPVVVSELELNEHELNDEEIKGLTVAKAFAQASYIEAQVMRARVEGIKRIKRDQFNSNPVMKNIFFKKGGIERQGFEVYKDDIQLKEAVEAKRITR